jgi:protein-tyrosine-phosphatase
MAKAFYNRLTGSNDANAAGTEVKEAGQTLQERKQTSKSKNFYLFDVMEDIGYDISQQKRWPLNRDKLNQYDLVVSMALPQQSPDWLLNAPNYTYWDVRDPRGQDYDTTAQVRDEILARVKKLIEAR